MSPSPIDPYRYRPKPSLTAPEAAGRAGVDYETARRVNRALGLPDTDDTSIEFSEKDVDVLRALKDLIDRGIPLNELLAVARVYGQSMARLADAETRIFQKHFVDPLLQQGNSSQDIEERLEPVVSEQLQLLGSVLDYVHRRHLGFAVQHLTVLQSDASTQPLAVGFVDLVDFAQLADELLGAELGEMVDRFEEIAIGAGTDPSVRVVKMIGDAALMVAKDPMAALEAVHAVVKEVQADERLPTARAGLDYGDVVPVAGDYFGRPVNVAARIVAFARPGTTVVSKTLLEGADQERIDVADIGKHKLKGVGQVRLFKVREIQPQPAPGH